MAAEAKLQMQAALTYIRRIAYDLRPPALPIQARRTWMVSGPCLVGIMTSTGAAAGLSSATRSVSRTVSPGVTGPGAVVRSRTTSAATVEPSDQRTTDYPGLQSSSAVTSISNVSSRSFLSTSRASMAGGLVGWPGAAL